MSFEFATATRIIFGAGGRFDLPSAAASFDGPGLLVTGKETARTEWIRTSRLVVQEFSVPAEPDIELVSQGARIARKAGARIVIACGGGSVIDAGKAIAALATNTRPILDYLEVIGSGNPLEYAPLPVLALPTTAGTGAEVTRNAVLSSPEHQLKVSLRSARMIPQVAIVDPELMFDLPPGLTASTGLDALTQLIEPFLSSRANPMTDALCRDGIPRAFHALPRAFRGDQTARSDMALASLFGGMALANAGLGAVHGFAAPIGGMFPAPHGAVCAALLPHVLNINLEAIRQRAPGSDSLERFQELARLLSGGSTSHPEDAVRAVAALCGELGMPKLGEFGVTPAHFLVLSERAAHASSMRTNPIKLTNAELMEILTRAA